MNIDLILRAIKGAPLTFNEVDNNFDLLKAAIITTLQNSAGTTAPPNPVAYQWWLDTSSAPNVLKLRNADNDEWLTFALIDQATDKVLFAVGQGGTGRDTLTANAVVIGDGTNAVKLVSAGSNGDVLTVDGGQWVSAVPPAAAIVYQA
jgi:hypothetical protein